MPEVQRIDLKSLIKFIVDQKELQANLILDEGCLLQAHDVKPLIKVFNYFFNFLRQLTDHPIQVGLDLMTDHYLLSLLVYTQKTEMPAIPDSVGEVLQNYNGRYEIQQQAGSFVQVKLYFKR